MALYPILGYIGSIILNLRVSQGYVMDYFANHTGIFFKLPPFPEPVQIKIGYW